MWRKSRFKVTATWMAIAVVAIMQTGIAAMAHDDQIVNANVLTRVLHLKVGNNTGTGFTVEVDGRQYLITAKHLTGEAQIEELEIWRKGWQKINVDVVGSGIRNEDITVLAADRLLTQTLPVEVGSGGITVGQNVRFLGFPLGFSMDFMEEQGGMRLPLVKGGILSGLKFENKVSWLLVDGHNNGGFSGGPILFRPLGNKEGIWKVAGVISGYHVESVDVKDAMNRTIGSAQGNSGILVATGIETASKLIEANSIGFPVSRQ